MSRLLDDNHCGHYITLPRLHGSRPYSSYSMSQNQGQSKDTADAYNVFQKVDELVSKPVSGSNQALQWQNFRQDKKLNTTTTRRLQSSAPMAPLSKSQRASGFASWKDEQKHEESLRRERSDAPLHQRYTAFSSSSQQQQQAGLTKKQIKRIQSKIRPDEQEYFIPSQTFAGSKFDYVFTTRPERGTGYYWDGSDSVKRLENADATSVIGSSDVVQEISGVKDAANTFEKRPAESQDAGDNQPEQSRKKSKTKNAPPTFVETSNHPLEQIAALLQSRQVHQVALPLGWEQATDVATKLPYYFNRTTGERTWEKPFDVAVSAKKDEEVTSEWKSATDAASNKTYYYNAAGETRWDDPNVL
ncbi:hypothetical protein MPSEU_000906100 [Mayamaea pseudoterrestris]|nr:hypothetical protein MPSEU_000906100 [Mayamaea pseudoterrestris]